MTSVFSARLIQQPSVTGGPLLAYTAPVGFLTVVKCITIVWGDVTVSGLDAWVVDDSGAKLVRRTIALGGGDPQILGGVGLYYGAWAYNGGDGLSVQTASGTADFLASGYQLTLP